MSTKSTPSYLLPFPSVSSSLHTLPQASSIHTVALHQGTYIPAARAAESKEKLQRALSLARFSTSKATLPSFRDLPAPPPLTSGQDPEQLTIHTVCILLSGKRKMCSLKIFIIVEKQICLVSCMPASPKTVAQPATSPCSAYPRTWLVCPALLFGIPLPPPIVSYSPPQCGSLSNHYSIIRFSPPHMPSLASIRYHTYLPSVVPSYTVLVACFGIPSPLSTTHPVFVNILICSGFFYCARYTVYLLLSCPCFGFLAGFGGYIVVYVGYVLVRYTANQRHPIDIQYGAYLSLSEVLPDCSRIRVPFYLSTMYLII